MTADGIDAGFAAFCARFGLVLTNHFTPQMQNDVFTGKFDDFTQIRGSVSFKIVSKTPPRYRFLYFHSGCSYRAVYSIPSFP